MSGLSLQQERFVAEYMIDMNATQAAIRAGYSAKTAKQQGSRLLSIVDIAAAIAARHERVIERLEVSEERIILELARIGFADIRKAVRWGKSPDTEGKYPVELVPSEEMDDNTAAAISEVSLTESGVKIKMYDKPAALVNLGKHIGMWRERQQADVVAPASVELHLHVDQGVNGPPSYKVIEQDGSVRIVKGGIGVPRP